MVYVRFTPPTKRIANNVRKLQFPNSGERRNKSGEIKNGKGDRITKQLYNMANSKRIRLKVQDRIALAAIALLGREVLPAAYAMCHPSVTTTNADSLSTMYSRWFNQPQAKAYRIELADIIARRAKLEGADLTTREGIISELVTSVKQASGREAISGLQSLAKLQGYDRPTERAGSEQRRYYLPYVSKCRTCELMKLYRRVQDDAEADE